MAIVKVNWSGGKDSTCASLLHILRGDKAKLVCYIPMFTKEIPLITKKHYEFITNTAEYFRTLGADVYIVSGMTYYDFVSHKRTRGKDKGKAMGFPLYIEKMCSFKNYSKISAIKKCDVGFYDYEDVGIAFDEPNRQGQLNDFKRSILVEEQYTELMAKQKCVEYNILSPHYENDTRDGCALCPHAPIKRREQWFIDYPEAIPLVIELQNLVKRECPERVPLRNKQWFL
ncbi:MAG: hypothetical protein J6A96_02090 [Clostridia bacterium]|nr:hypothetical protein [Clostridia bacterium]